MARQKVMVGAQMIAKALHPGYYDPPITLWAVTEGGAKIEKVQIVRVRGTCDSFESRNDYADLLGYGVTVSTHYLFPKKPSLYAFKDRFGEFHDWAVEASPSVLNKMIKEINKSYKRF